MRPHVILAVFKRNVASYFSGVLGYLFIVAFVVAGGFLAFDDRFFTENLATLDRLSDRFAMLLLFIVPAITMTVWAEERKLGTDELLFTLPASDVEVLFGKFAAVKTVYFIALLFSLAHAFMLEWIGSPDWGLIATTFLGYWLAGVAMLAIGMLASSLTSSATVAFVLGVVLCAIPVFIDRLPFVGETLKPLAVGARLEDFTLGVFPSTGILYFLSLCAFALYLNAIVLGKRHWSARKSNGGMAWQYAVRAVALVIALSAANYMTSFAAARFDMTSEKIFTLTNTTRDVLRSIPDDRPVTIQAFVSPEMPQQFVQISRELNGLLRQLDNAGGRSVQVRYVDVEPFSEEAEEAEQRYGISPRTVQSEQNGRFSTTDIFLAVQVASGFDEVVIPFFDQGTAIEYQLARAIGTVSKEERLTVGVLSTDAQVMGGFDSSAFRQLPRWQVIEELSKQYRTVDVSPDSPIDADAFDVLLAVLPSSLTEPQMNHFVEYVRNGGPTLVFDDPVPVFNPSLAPSQPKPSPGGGGGMFGGQNNGPPKADNGRLTALANTLDIQWESDQVVFDLFNPHPQFASIAPSVLLFVSPKGDNPLAIDQQSEVTAGMEEVVAYYSGKVVPRQSDDVQFTPLLSTSGNSSGIADWSEVTFPSMFGGVQLNPNYQAFSLVEDEEKERLYAIAGELNGKPDGDTPDLHVIFVADADLISNTMYSIQDQALYGLRIDNITFLMNAIDKLAGDTKYNALRSRRAKFRTLERVEQETTTFIQDANAKRTEAESEAEERIKAANARLDEVEESIEADTTLDATAKRQQIRNALAAEQRRVDKETADIELAKAKEIRSVEAATQRKVRSIENGIRFWTLVLPPIPAILLGAIVLAYRKATEESGMPSDRTVSR